MKDIARMSDRIRHNIHEAREKIREAYELRDTDRAEADWLRDMAKAHLDFNTKGHDIVTALIAEAEKSRASAPELPGMQAVYKQRHAEIVREAAEVAAMIAGYK